MLLKIVGHTEIAYGIQKLVVVNTYLTACQTGCIQTQQVLISREFKRNVRFFLFSDK